MANGDFGLGFDTDRRGPLNPFLDERRKPGGFDPRLSLGAGFLGEADPPFDFPGGPYSQEALSNLQRLGSVFGRGRRAADRGVQAYENPFGRELADIVRKRDAGDIAGAQAQFSEAWNRYRQGVNQGVARGGQDAVVAQQSLNNPLLRQTANDIAGSLGLGTLSWEANRSSSPNLNVGGSTMPNLKNLANVFSGGRNQLPGLRGGQTGRTSGYLPNISEMGPKLGDLPGSRVGSGETGAIGTIIDLVDLISGRGKKPQLQAPPVIYGPKGPPPGWFERLRTLIGESVDEPWARGVATGSDILGRFLQGRALDQHNEEMRKEARAERARRDFFSRAMLPNLLRGSGYSPEGIAQKMKEFPVSDPERRT